MEFRGKGGVTEVGAEVVEERSVAERVHRVDSHSPAAIVVYGRWDFGCGETRISGV